MKLRLGFFGIFSSLFASFTITAIVVPPAAGAEPRPLQLFANAGSGYGWVTGSEYSNGPDGLVHSLGVFLSGSGDRWITDAGAGWMLSRLDGSFTDGRAVAIRTRSGWASLGTRLRVGPRWQVGPETQLAFGADNSFAPSVGGASTALFVGPKLVYEIPGRNPFRAWTTLVTDLTIGGRQAWVASAGVQLGFPIGGGNSRQEPRVEPAQADASDSRRDVRVLLDPRQVFFKTDSVRLRPEVRQALERIGDLMEGPVAGASLVVISGHADVRGSYQYNLSLSKRRAEAVRSALVLRGPAEGRVEVRAMSFSRPVAEGRSSDALARNRRVEIVFHDVADPDALIRELRPLKAVSISALKAAENKGNS